MNSDLPAYLTKRFAIAFDPSIYQTTSNLEEISHIACVSMEAAGAVCDKEFYFSIVLHHVEAIFERVWILHEMHLSNVIVDCKGTEKGNLAKSKLESLNITYQNVLNLILSSEYGYENDQCAQILLKMDAFLEASSKASLFLRLH